MSFMCTAKTATPGNLFSLFVFPISHTFVYIYPVFTKDKLLSINMVLLLLIINTVIIVLPSG